MKGKYKNLEGETVDILQHDEANKIVYIQTAEGERKWIATADCQWWQSLDAVPQTIEEVKLERIKSCESPTGVLVTVEELVPKEESQSEIEEEKPVEIIAPKLNGRQTKNKKK